MDGRWPRVLAATRRLHAVLVAPPWYPVPPYGYGGIELMVGLLADQLRALGHRVTLFAAQGSERAEESAPAGLHVHLGLPAAGLHEAIYLARVSAALRQLGDVDIIHDHSSYGGLLCVTRAGSAPVVHTVHGPLEPAPRSFYRELGDAAGLVAISNAQHSAAPELNWSGVVHNAVDLAGLDPRRQAPRRGDPYLLCLARIDEQKGQHLAIEVARRLGMRLVLAGKVDSAPAIWRYFHHHVEPWIDGDRVVRLENVGGEAKAALLREAAALLAPIAWEEPFGLNMAEALASGTPVVAFRRGAAPEIVTHGVTGYLVDDVDEMVSAVRRVSEIDRQACRRSAEERFSPALMAHRYVTIYEQAITRPGLVPEPDLGRPLAAASA
jgi:glycosyltransferase involved in cell wall biosynthesis